MTAAKLDNQTPMSAGLSWVLFSAVACIMFVASFSTMATMGALSQIRYALDLSLSQQAWVVIGFSIAVTAFVMHVGQLTRRFGYLPLFIVGLVIFFVSGVINAVTTAGWLLIVGRIIQGFSYAFLFPTTLGLLKYGPKKSLREKFLVLWIAFQVLGYFVGPLVGGILAEHATWRLIYWINCAFCILALILTAFFYQQCNIPKQKAGFDFFGLILLVALSVIIVLTVSEGSYWGWVSAPLITFYALIPILFMVFIWSQSFVKSPVMNLAIFKNLPFVIGALQYFLLGAVIYGSYYFINLYLQDNSSINYGPLMIGLMFLILGGGMLVFSLMASYFRRKLGFFLNFFIGTIVITAGLAFFWLMSNDTLGVFWWKMLILGVGLGIAYSLCSDLALSTIKDERGGEAAALINLGNYLGCTIGIALVQLIYLSSIKTQIIFLQKEVAALASFSLNKLLLLPHATAGAFNDFIQLLPNAETQLEVKAGLHHAVDHGFALGNLYFAVWALVAVFFSLFILACNNKKKS